jgi:hypothetical protein
MPIVNNVQSSFGARRNKLTSSITEPFVNNIVADTILKAKVTILQVKPVQATNGYSNVEKQRSTKAYKLKDNPLDNGLVNKKNKMMF